jgi:hypothetical protein
MPIIRSKNKRIQEELIGLIWDIWVNKLQICQTIPLCIFWAIFGAIG